MKKNILPGLILGAIMMTAPSVQSNAQIRNDRGTFTLPGNGDVLVETQTHLNLAGGSIFSLNDGFLSNLNNGLDTTFGGFTGGNYFPMLKLRFFSGNNMAHRLLFNISYSSNRQSNTGTDFKTSNFGIAVTYGLEKIFTPAERLNTYVGADITAGYTRIGAEAGPFDVSQNAFGLGLRGFTGMDYYILPKVYMGLELGWGVGFNRYGEVEFASGNSGTTTNNFTITPYVTPTFRLGYVLGWSKKTRGNGEPDYRSRDSYNDED
ncbi:MAG: hypothetical protein EOP49_13355 [Sphingobacteriales bacterium]|nr:MAG: hypothetical protein EOP49_13355 [Sphingobacteriales bacterium]